MAYDAGRYEGQRRNIRDEYAGKMVANDFGRFTSQQRGKRQMGDYTRNWKRGHNNFMGGLSQRGLTGGGVRSGVANNAISRRVSDYGRQMGYMQNDLDQQLRGYDFEAQQLNAWKQKALADLEMQERQEIALAALQINALKPYLGS